MEGRSFAAALAYDPETDEAPRMVAKGYGMVAERIKELAREHDVPISEDPHLADLLAQIELDRDIPPALYEAVAELLAYIFQVEKLAAERDR